MTGENEGVLPFGIGRAGFFAIFRAGFALEQ
jgi:hypothetical protein